MSLIKRRLFVARTKIIMHPQTAASLCALPYPGHKKGCPNLGKVERCPPTMDVYEKGQFVAIAAVKFDLASHAERMQDLHPEWSEKQCYCCLYWQGTARKALRKLLESFPYVEEFTQRPYIWNHTPEARGADVFQMMEMEGYLLERKYPLCSVWKIAFAEVD